MSQLTQFIPGAGGGWVDTITGNVGGAVGPDGAGNINFTGAAGQITITGNPGANSLVASITNGANGQLLIGGGAAATWGALSSASGTITFVPGANTLDLNVAGIVAVSFVTDAGTATPAIGVINTLGGTNINTAGGGSTVTINLDAAVSGIDSVDFNTGGRIGTDTGAGDTYLLQAYDVDGVAYTTFATLTANNTPTMDLSDDVTKSGGYIYRAGGTDVPVTDGGTGVSTLTDHGLLVGSGVGAITALGVATDGQLPIGSTGADPVLGNITSATDLTVTNGAGTINIDFTANTNLTTVHGWNGSLIETADVTVTAAAGTITLSIQKVGTGDLTAVFSDGFDDWDTTPPDTVTLTAGSDTSPQINYVYYLQSTKTLTASTVGWPATEFAAVATVLCQSAASLQTDGAYKVHVWTDNITEANDQGHITTLNKWIRQQNATWVSGVAQTLTITPNVGTPDNVIFTSSAGVVYQLHEHVFPAFGGTPDVYTVNDSVTSYNIVTDLNALLTDSTGVSMSGRFFSLVIWGVQSEATGDCKLMVNLPSGSYITQAALEADSSKFADFSIPSDFKGTGFLIYQMNLKHSVASGGTWTSISNIDLRGLFPNLAAGGGTAAGTTFPDNAFRIFDDGDSTKEIAFEASAITTATTRTITMDDRNIDMDAVPDSFPTDSGTATPAAGVLTVAGGTNIATSGAGSTVTIAIDSTIGVPNGGTGAATLTDHGILLGSGVGAITPLGVATDGQLPIGSSGADPVLAAITAGTGISIVNGAGSITISAPDSGVAWTEVTGTSQSMAVNNAYILNNAALVTATLPATAAVGDVLIIVGKGAGGWTMAQNAGQTVHFISSDTTTGAGGSISSTVRYDSLEVVCTTADTDFVVRSSVGNLTVV